MSTPQPATPPVGAVQRALEWLLGDTEPVRRALYPVVVALVALLVGYGFVADERAALWLGLGAAILGPGATEAARRVAYAPRSVVDYGEAWQAEVADEYARGVADALERTPERVAAEVVDDEPGEHAVDRVAEPETTNLRAPSRATRCREVDDGRRCALSRGHAGPHWH